MSASSSAAAGLFLLLAAFWQPPDNAEFTADLANGSVDADIASLGAQAGYPPRRQKNGLFRTAVPPGDALQKFYACHINGSGSESVLPVESLYKRWTEDPTARLPIAGSTGFLMGDAAMHVQYLLDSYAMSVPTAYRMMPDHLALLLELAAFLLENRPPEESSLFVSQHFDWMDSLARSLSGIDPKDAAEQQAQKFYLLALQVLQETVACELTREIK